MRHHLSDWPSLGQSRCGCLSMNKLKVKNKKLKVRGFTLIELMVASTIFIIVMVIAISSVLNIINVNRKAQSLNSIMTNLSFALESMVREYAREAVIAPLARMVVRLPSILPLSVLLTILVSRLFIVIVDQIPVVCIVRKVRQTVISAKALMAPPLQLLRLL